MAEENRGKRRKQANPRRNRECSLGSEGEDEGCVWGTDVQDEKNGQDKISLTPSEGTEAGSPARFTRAPSLSPSLEQWDEAENMALPTTPGESEKSAYAHKETCVVEDWTQYDFLMQLRKVSHLSHQQHSQQLNGSALSYHTGGMQDDTSSTVSPSAQESPERKDVEPGSPDATQTALHMCPFCQQTYQHGTYLREHMKVCQERESAHSLCPLCGYSTPYRAHMERHMALHVQVKEKIPVSDPNMEKRKFKCTQCGKAFKYKHHLKEHLRIHSGEKPYECSNCKKRFSHSGSYSSHLSSKKCLSGGGPGNGSFFNGHTLPAHSFPSPTSPSTARSRNISKGKSSPYAPMTHYFTEQTANQGHADTLLASDLGRPWDAAAAIRMGVFQGTTLLPLLQSGGKFEALLQEMLRKEAGMEEQRRSRQEKHQANKTEGREGENDVPVVNVSCPWCFQLFPNEVVLKQHERYLCKAKSKEQQEVAQLHYHREGSPLNFLHVSKIPHVNRKMPTTPNGMSIELSSPQQVSWHSVPQQLLVPLQSPVHLRPDSSHGIWLNKQTGSPTDSSLMSPKSPSVHNHQHPGFSSPPCLDLSITLPSRPPQQRPSPRSGDSQNEPLDLSIPKVCTTSNTSKEAREQACNGSSLQRDRRDVERLNRKLTSPSQHHMGGAYPPLFGSAVFSSYPYFNPIIPNGLAAMGHNGVTPLPLTPPAPSPGFLSPMTYMMEAESETLLKRMQQERIAIGDARNHSSLDYLSLMEEGMDGDSGPGRKRLRKTEEGLYACDICDKSFQKSSSLLRHKYEHTGKRPHECQICKKAFKHKHHLIEHSRLHSGEKPYQCDKCGKRFSHSGSYSQHMNHRYAFCGQDQDPDGPVDEQVGGDMTLYTSSYRELNPETEDAPLTLEETATFFSNSIRDRTPLGFNAENGNERESSVSNHDRNEERRMDIEKSGDLEMATEEEKKEEEVEGQATKSNHHSTKIKAEQNGRTEEKRDSQAINLETV